MWHIREGNYGEERLNDLNVLMLASFVGNVWAEHSDAYAAVFLDERAAPGQLDALQMIFGGQAGSWPAQMVTMLAPQMRGMGTAPIEVEIDTDLATWRAAIPGKVDARAEALTGPTTPHGARVQSTNLPGSETGPGQLATWGRAGTDRVDAFGFTWNRTGQSSKTITFDWSGPD